MYRPFRFLKGLLIAGVVLGFGSGFASIAHHHRYGCHGGPGGWRSADEWSDARVTPAPQAPAPVAAPQTVVVPQAAPQPVVLPQAAPQIIVISPQAAPSAAPVVVTPQAVPAAVPVVVQPQAAPSAAVAPTKATP